MVCYRIYLMWKPHKNGKLLRQPETKQNFIDYKWLVFRVRPNWIEIGVVHSMVCKCFVKFYFDECGQFVYIHNSASSIDSYLGCEFAFLESTNLYFDFDYLSLFLCCSTWNGSIINFIVQYLCSGMTLSILDRPFLYDYSWKVIKLFCAHVV